MRFIKTSYNWITDTYHKHKLKNQMIMLQIYENLAFRLTTH